MIFPNGVLIKVEPLYFWLFLLKELLYIYRQNSLYNQENYCSCNLSDKNRAKTH